MQTKTTYGNANKTKRSSWQACLIDNLEWIIQAVILAVIIRCFVLEAFVIPTGSMAPTLYGRHVKVTCPNCGLRYDVGMDRRTGMPYPGIRCPNCFFTPTRTSRVQGGDKIMVNKLYYQFFPIKRWDIIVFKSPEAIEKNLIKRVVGLPNEQLRIVDGNVLINGTVAHKPPPVQRKFWMLVHDSRFMPADKVPIWSLGEGWHRTNGGLEVESSKDRQRPTYASFLPEVRDLYAYYPNSGRNIVGDAKVALQVSPRAGNGSLLLELSHNDRTFRCILPLQAEAPVRLEDNGQEVARVDNAGYLHIGNVTRVEFANLDYLISLKIAGKEVLSYNYWQGTGGLDTYTRQNSVRIGTQDLSLSIDSIKIYRDIYYLPASDGRSTFRLGKGEYFVMGDACPNSGDSRRLGGVPQKDMLGKALLVWWPPTRARLVR